MLKVLLRRPMAAGLVASPAMASTGGSGAKAHASRGDVPPVIPAIVRTRIRRTENTLDRLTSRQRSGAWGRWYVKEALATGRPAGREPAPALEAAATDAGTTPDALALAAVLTRPWADVILSGAATVETLRSNLGATALAWTEDLERRLAPLAEDRGRNWARRAALAWN